MELHSEYLNFLNDEIKAFDKELISILELPDVRSIRARIKKDKRNTQSMLNLYSKITATNEAIRAIKVRIRNVINEAHKQLGIKKRMVENERI